MAIGTDTDLIQQGIIYEHDDRSSTVFCLQNDFGDTLQSKRNLIVYLISKGIYGYLFSKLFKRSIIEDNNIRFNTNSHFREDEEFFSKYLLYVKSWRSSYKSAYLFLLPYGAKTYKGNSFQSLIPIFKYLDTIFDGQYPSAISNIHTRNIKDMITIKCYNGEIPTEYECDLYNRLVQDKSRMRGYALIDRFITGSHKKRSSRYALIIIHTISKLIKHLKGSSIN